MGLILVVVITFGVLMFFGIQTYRKASPVAKKIAEKSVRYYRQAKTFNWFISKGDEIFAAGAIVLV